MPGDHDHVFYSGAIDAFYNYCFGRLGYRNVYWERNIIKGDFQGCSIINYPELKEPYTRIHEHKYFSPWETHEHSSVFTEFSRESSPVDEPFYPKRLAQDLQLLSKYQALAKQEECATFIGRLGTYRYLDMHVVISEARKTASNYLTAKHDA